jgi:hypothetical protein
MVTAVLVPFVPSADCRCLLTMAAPFGAVGGSLRLSVIVTSNLANLVEEKCDQGGELLSRAFSRRVSGQT